MVVFAVVIYKAFIGFSWYVSFYNLFDLNRKVGILVDYKFLRGNALNNDTNFVRVNSMLAANRTVNFKTAAWVEVGAGATRFARRDRSFNRTFYGPVRPR